MKKITYDEYRNIKLLSEQIECTEQEENTSNKFRFQDLCDIVDRAFYILFCLSPVIFIIVLILNMIWVSSRN